MKIYISLLVLALMVGMRTPAQTKTIRKPTIVFVHGIWADGSSFAKQIKALHASGYDVKSVQNPITSLSDDVVATQRIIDQIEGPVILVGHSWGGFVISQFSQESKVEGLVYIAAFAPEMGESVASLNEKVSNTTLSKYFIVQNSFVYLSEQGVKTAFAPDLDAKDQALIYATQTPAAQHIFSERSKDPAWKNKPTWYIVAKNDKAINPDLERFMAKRSKGKTIEISSSHVIMNSHPKEVLQVIKDAANYKY
ncbi:alpha/beta hydrolase [Rhizosphaericola mali]|uniref:Alpha/beta hydrolase n=1 Tax=Rhizosphaericola mali TaxID=2545455 RepID=A0A5P2G6E6_9BACT|nr:alpha/beta hydrolase [Rhizosphaericola mali]QES88793.1 alpha/beta hydrolase [Rhizosphaericola mali]